MTFLHVHLDSSTEIPKVNLCFHDNLEKKRPQEFGAIFLLVLMLHINLKKDFTPTYCEPFFKQ